jgi:hypothetical protein
MDSGGSIVSRSTQERIEIKKETKETKETNETKEKKILSQSDKIKKLEEELDFYKSLFRERNNSCIFNLRIKQINGKNVWVDRVHDQREDFLQLDKDDEVTEWLRPVRCER